jgi:hypothetical protein
MRELLGVGRVCSGGGEEAEVPISTLGAVVGSWVRAGWTASSVFGDTRKEKSKKKTKLVFPPVENSNNDFILKLTDIIRPKRIDDRYIRSSTLNWKIDTPNLSISDSGPRPFPHPRVALLWRHGGTLAVAACSTLPYLPRFVTAGGDTGEVACAPRMAAAGHSFPHLRASPEFLWPSSDKVGSAVACACDTSQMYL